MGIIGKGLQSSGIDIRTCVYLGEILAQYTLR